MRLPIALIAASALIAGCATQKGNDRHAQHAADQIKMVAVQRDAQLKEAQAESATQVALVEALAEVAKANPEHAPSVAVALAVIGVRGAEATSQDTPVIGLQQQRNEALEWTKALAPTVGGLVNGLGVAAIQASVTKKQAEITRDIQINDANSDVAIVEAVSNLGVAAVGAGGLDVGGDYYAVQDEAVIDRSTNTTTTTTTTSTETNTTTTTTSGDTIDDNSANTSYVTSLGAMSDGQIADVVLNGGAVDIYTAGGVVTVTDDNLCDLFPALTACAP